MLRETVPIHVSRIVLRKSRASVSVTCCLSHQTAFRRLYAGLDQEGEAQGGCSCAPLRLSDARCFFFTWLILSCGLLVIWECNGVHGGPGVHKCSVHAANERPRDPGVQQAGPWPSVSTGAVSMFTPRDVMPRTLLVLQCSPRSAFSVSQGD